MTRLVATVHETDPIAAAGAVRRATGADVVEVRLDALWPDAPAPEAATTTLLALLDAAGETPLLATLRPRRQGGSFHGDETVRLGLLQAALDAGFRWVDLELDLARPGAVVRHFRNHAERIIISDHRLPKAPSREDGLRWLLGMQDSGADHHKLAFPASSFLDRLRALELVRAHAARNGRPAVTPYAHADAATRCLLAVAGNTLTYGHAGTPATPGQPSLTDLRIMLTHWGLTSQELQGLDPDRDHFAVLGGDVAESLSPRIHNAALRAAGRQERYGAMDVPDSIGAMRLVANVARRVGLAGASVTRPLKLHARDVAQADDTARRAGAANCLRFTDHGPEATNTDVTAFHRILAAHAGSTVLVLGAGGAARAAALAALDHGCRVRITNRGQDRSDRLATDLDIEVVPWRDRTTAAEQTQVLVQATPLGRDGSTPFEAGMPDLASLDLVVELVYGPHPTPLEDATLAAGTALVDGRSFLLEQAVDAYQYWTGDAPDRDAMAAALERTVEATV